MNALKTASFELTNLPPHQRRYLKDHVTCPMCESDLKMTHDIDKNQQKVKEQAYCPSCRMRARNLISNLH
jgi:rubredoxin